MFHPCQETLMTRPAIDQRPLFDAWLPWEQLPDPVREQALELLTTICLESLDLARMEPKSDDRHDD
jgi:hypothetical protein